MKSPAEVLRRIVDEACADFDRHELTTVQVSLDQEEVIVLKALAEAIEVFPSVLERQ